MIISCIPLCLLNSAATDSPASQPQNHNFKVTWKVPIITASIKHLELAYIVPTH